MKYILMATKVYYGMEVGPCLRGLVLVALKIIFLICIIYNFLFPYLEGKAHFIQNKVNGIPSLQYHSYNSDYRMGHKIILL